MDGQWYLVFREKCKSTSRVSSLESSDNSRSKTIPRRCASKRVFYIAENIHLAQFEL